MAQVQPERWARVAPSWLGHRGEPLIHERMWACPHRVVLGAAAERQARHDWRPLLTTTDDFIVSIAVHDEG